MTAPPPDDGQRIDWDSPPPGYVTFDVEAWPHDSGANGSEGHSGCLPAAQAARVFRDIADRIDRYWADPECPWAGQPGHAPAPPPVDDEQRRRDEAAARAAKQASLK